MGEKKKNFGSCHFHTFNKENVNKIKIGYFFVLIRKLRWQAKLPPTLESEEAKEPNNHI